MHRVSAGAGELVLRNARVVAGGEVLRGEVCVRDGRIAAVDSKHGASGMDVDLEGDYLVPGLVELHTDNFERHMMPRPKVRWPVLPALFGHDAEIAAAGITTVYDALGVGDSDPEAMRGQDMAPVLAAIDQAASQGLLRAEHRLHIRVELSAPNTRELFEPFADHALVGLISLMDHTPGQRQWENIEQARIYYCGKKGWSDAKFERSVAESKGLQERNATPNRRHFVDYSRKRGIPLASHDDTKVEHVEQAHGEGVAISEFPTQIEAAQAARARGMAIVMGAPNVVRGGSHSGNVAAVDLARLGLLDSPSSDYVPSSLLMAAFRLVPDAGFSIAQAVATVSLNPARAAGLEDRGEIAPGLRADLVQVRMVGEQPIVRAVWREGRRIV
jgi:alpha-D-ribose 1-methylphosphonate 5-triphosphate diphosphatase